MRRFDARWAPAITRCPLGKTLLCLVLFCLSLSLVLQSSIFGDMWHYSQLPLLAIFCSLGSSFGAPISSHLRCRASAPVIPTLYGSMKGFDVGNGVTRITLPYAQPPVGPLRFANPQPVTNYSSHDATKTPPSCYQGRLGAIGGNAMSEDCLYNTFYVPSVAVSEVSRLPILVWVHGGSGIAGSSTAAGLDGSVIAAGQEAIVVILQYRLGLFGWLQTSETIDEETGGGVGGNKVAGNQAIRDVIMALQQVKDLAKAIGGDGTKIALMGQSSGASMVRALLATPAAEHLFSHAVIVSDTADYGLSSVADHNTLGDFAMEKLGCGLSDLKCARDANADSIVQATLAAYSTVPYISSGIAAGTPWRAMRGRLVSGSISEGSGISASKKPVIMSTVMNEAGSLMSHHFQPSPAGATELTFTGTANTACKVSDALSRIFDGGRGLALSLLSTVYPTLDVMDGLRSMVETTATDGLWRCPTQSNAVALAASSSLGNVWLAQWNVGSTYPSNKNADYCNGKEGHVCHEDDIYAIFGTAPRASEAYAKLSLEWRRRLISFVNSGKPNPPGMMYWPPVQDGSHLHMLSLGIQGNLLDAVSSIQLEQRHQACQQVWSKTVKYDWQLYESS